MNRIEKYKINVDENKWQIKWQKSFEKSLLLFITGKCNLNCDNCFSISTRNSVEMSIEQIEAIIDSNPEYEKVDLMGGEPLLHSNINEIVNLLIEKNKKVSIYTNAIAIQNLKEYHSGVRVCVSFHEINSSNPSRKPILPILKHLQSIVNNNSNELKLVLLIDDKNYLKVMDMIKFVETEIPALDRITIGLVRFENDYWNSDYEGVLSFKKYAKVIQEIVDTYNGRLNIDIFLKGVLDIKGYKTDLENQVNRFMCVFQDMSYASCLYNACDYNHDMLDDTYKLPESKPVCTHTGFGGCLADKVKLINNKNV